ncbi:hypothetical protein BJX62DRAFT_80634 [Aspergillus germanicus]
MAPVTSTQREDKLVQYSAELTQANISNKVVPKLRANETTGTEKAKLVFRSPENLSRLLVYFASSLMSIQRVVMGSWLCRLPPGFPGRSREYWSKSAGILGARLRCPIETSNLRCGPRFREILEHFERHKKSCHINYSQLLRQRVCQDKECIILTSSFTEIASHNRRPSLGRENAEGGGLVSRLLGYDGAARTWFDHTQKIN